MAKPAYFHLTAADNDDRALGDAKTLGYVPTTCLLGGILVWQSVNLGLDPCAGCNGPRSKCGGRPKQDDVLGASLGSIESALLRYREELQMNPFPDGADAARGEEEEDRSPRPRRPGRRLVRRKK